MKEEWKKILIIIFFGLLLFFLGRNSKEPEIIKVEKPVYYEDLQRIEELEKIIAEREDYIETVKVEIVREREVVKVEKEKIQKLEPDSGVLVLRQFLEDYTGEVQDSFPALCSDSLVCIDSIDLGNINSVFLDHKSDLRIIESQSDIIRADSLTKYDYGVIIQTQDNIRRALEETVEKERKSKELWRIIGVSGISTTIILTLLSLW